MKVHVMFYKVLGSLIIVCVLSACHQSVRPSPPKPVKKIKPLRISDRKSAQKKGAFVARISGGGLASAIDMMLWLQYDNGVNDCSIHLEIDALVLHTKDIYVAQDNLYCGRGPICKVIHPQTGKMITPKSCIEGDELNLTSHRHLRDDYYVITSAAEGYAIAQIIRYDPIKGQKTLLDIPMGLIHTAEVSTRRDGAFLIETKCPMPAGCTTTSPESLAVKRYVWRAENPTVFHLEK